MRQRWIEAGQAWRSARPRPLPPAEHARLFANACIERHGGLTVLYLAGTPYEMGYQHGDLCRLRGSQCGLARNSMQGVNRQR